MSFVSQMFGSTPQQAQLTQGATGAQASQLYDQTQNGLSQQQAFVNATGQSNGLDNQNSVYQQLAGIANGTGPSVAQNQLNQSTQANVANQAALMAGQRGVSQNAGLLARQAAQQGATTQQQANGQAATLRATETTNALGQMGSLANTQVSQQQGALNSLNQYTQGAQSNVLGAIGNYNNSSVANANQYNNATAKNAQFTAGLIGGLGGSAAGLGSLFGSGSAAAGAATTGLSAGGGESLAGLGTMVAAHGGQIPEPSAIQKLRQRTQLKQDPKAMSQGGEVPGQAKVQGDSYSNDTVHTMLSPGEVVIPRSIIESKDPMGNAQKFLAMVLDGKGPKPKELDAKQALADGGAVSPENQGRLDALGQLIPDVNLPDMSGAGALFQAPDLSKMGAQIASDAQATSGLAPKEAFTPSMLMQDPAAQQPQAQAPQFQPQAPQAQGQNADPYGMDAFSKSMTSGIGMQQAGIKGMADAEGKVADQQAILAKQQAEDAQKAQASYQQHYQQLEQERAGFRDQLMKGQIDPDHFVNSMGTGQKVSTAIGLILGGIGGGAGMTNPAMDFLNKQIDKDIDAQKTNLGKTESLLNMNMKQFGNLHDATMATKAMMADVYSAKIQQAVASAGSQMAQARGQAAIGQLQQQTAPAMQQLAMRKAMMSGAGASPETRIRMMVPEGQQQAAYKELGEAQGSLKGRDNLLGAFQQVSKINTLGNAVMNPLQRSKQVDAIIEPLTAQLSKDSAGRFTEQDAEAIKKFFPAMGDSDATSKLKYQKLNTFISSKMHFPMLTAYGVNPISSSRFDENGKDRIQATKVGQ